MSRGEVKKMAELSREEKRVACAGDVCQAAKIISHAFGFGETLLGET